MKSVLTSLIQNIGIMFMTMFNVFVELAKAIYENIKEYFE